MEDADAYNHNGFFLRLALGGGRMVAKFSSDESRYSNGTVEGTAVGGGGAFDLMIGGTIAPGLALAGAISTLASEKPNAENLTLDGEDISNGSTVYWKRMNYLYLGPMLDWYIDPNQGFHVQGGVGLVGFSTEDAGTVDGVTVLEKHGAAGVGFVLGAGYEFWLAEEWSLGAMVRASYNVLSGQDEDQTIDISDNVLTFPSILITGTYH